MSQPRQEDFAGMDVLPCDQAIEASVLGAVLISPAAAIPVARELISPRDFYYSGHQIAFQAALDLFDSGVEPDSVALMSHLKAQGQLDQVGGSLAVMSWLNSVPSAWNIESHSRQVLEYARQRQVLNLCWRIRRDMARGAVKADDAIVGMKAEIEIISGRGVGLDEIQALQGVVDSHIGGLIQQYNRADSDHTLVSGSGGGITTGWPWLDDAMGGWCGGDLIIIGARPNTAKTRWTIHSLGVAARQSVPVGLISLDMSGQRLLRYMVPVLANINGANVLPDQVYRPHAWGEFEEGRLRDVSKLADPNGCFWLIDNPRGRTAQALEAYIRQLAKIGCKLIAIDQTQNIAGWASGAMDRGRFYQIISDIKEAARRHNVCILLLHQIQREGVDFPQMQHLKDTGAFEEYSDFVILLHDHQRSLLQRYGGYVVENGRFRKPKESEADVTSRELDPIRPLWTNLAKSRAGAARQEWGLYDFARGIRA